jgi:hypothetical protein
MTDLMHEERETDDMIDAWHERMLPITQAEIDATIKRLLDEQEEWERELLGRSRPDAAVDSERGEAHPAGAH